MSFITSPDIINEAELSGMENLFGCTDWPNFGQFT